MKDQAIASCRVSTPEQKLNNSLNRQEESVYNTAKELGVEVVRVWSGDASSKPGKNVLRKDLQEMLEYCKSNKRVKYLIVDEPDRFMRSIDEAFYFEVLFREFGVALWYASDPALNTGDLMSKVLKFTKLFPAEGGSVERQGKSVRGHEKAIREGRYTFPPKPGYRKGQEPGVHDPHPITYAPFQIALKEVLSGLYTPSEALKRLMATEFSTVYNRFGMDKFRHFGSDPYYAGILKVDRQVKAENRYGNHQPMITPEEHEKLCRIFAGTYKARGAKKHYNPEFPMGKLMTCEDCGGQMKFTGSRTHHGYFRQGAHGKIPRKIKYYWKYRCRGCGRAYHRHEVHAELDKLFESVKYKDTQQSEFMEALEKVWRQKQSDKLSDAKNLQVQIAELEDTKSRLVIEMVSCDESLKNDIKSEIENLKIKIARLQSQVADLKSLEDDMAQFVEFGLNYTDNLIDDWWDLDYETRLWCQQLIFPGGITFNSQKKVGTPFLSPIYTLQANKKAPENASDALVVELAGIEPASVGLFN